MQLADFAGVLQVDGYGAYKALVKDAQTKDRIKLAFCLAHARRKFVAVFKSTWSPFAREVIETIAAIYAIEKRIRGKDADERRAVRQAESQPIMMALHARLLAVGTDCLNLDADEGNQYTLGHWGGLTRFLDDGRLEPDTNIVERPIRPMQSGAATRCSAATRAAAKRGRFYRRWSTRQNQWRRSRDLADRRPRTDGLWSHDQ